MKKGSKFRCVICGREFRQSNDNKELEGNFAKAFPGEAVKEGKSACGECYDALMRVRKVAKVIYDFVSSWSKASLN